MPNTTSKIKIRFLKQNFTIAKLRSVSSIVINNLFEEKALFFLSQTSDELSIICEERFIDNSISHESNWSAMKVEGVIPFNCSGVLSSLLAPLAKAKISILAVSTFDTDYIFFKKENIENVRKVLFEITKPTLI